MVVSSSLVFARHFSHPRRRPPGPAPCMFQNGLLFLRNLGCQLIPLFWGLAGLRDRGTGTTGGSDTFKWASSKPQEHCHLPADAAPPPLFAYKAVFFFLLATCDVARPH